MAQLFSGQFLMKSAFFATVMLRRGGQLTTLGFCCGLFHQLLHSGMPQRISPLKVAHSHPQLRPDPLRLANLEQLDGRLSGSQLLNSRLQGLPLAIRG